MNDNTKPLDQNPGIPQAPVQPVAPLGSKERSVSSDVSEFVRPAGPELNPTLPQEVAESGVKVRNDSPILTSEHRDLGIDRSAQHVPVPQGPTLVQIPEGKGDVNDSGTWWNTLIRRVGKISRLKVA